MLSGLVEWWDGAELWLAQRWFPVQFVLVMMVLVPLCLALAWLIDKLVGKLAEWLRPVRDGDRADRPSHVD